MKKTKIKKRLLTSAIVAGAVGFTTINFIPNISVKAATVFEINNETEYKNAEGALNRLKKIYGNDINTWPEPSKSEGKAYEAAMKLYRIQNGGNNDGGDNSGDNNVPTYSTIYKNKYNATINYYLNDNIIATKKFENVDSSFVGNNFYEDSTNQYLLEDKPTVVGNEIIGWYIPPISNDAIGEKIGQYTTVNQAERKKIITRTYKATVSAEPIYKYRTVTFTDENGNVLNTQRVEYGEELQAPVVEERESQNFNGWSIDLESARYTTGDVTIKETWKDKKQYTVRFYDDDYKTLIKEEIVYEGGTANPPVVEREGYKVKYWSRVGGVSNSLENIRENAFFRAVYEKLYLVVVTDGYGNVLSKQYIEKGGSISTPDSSDLPQKREYRFKGWRAGEITSKNSIETFIITKDTTISPIWEELELYTIIFEDEEGNELKKEQLYYLENIEPPLAPKSKTEGLLFDYWSNKDGQWMRFDNFNVAFKDITFIPVYRDYAKVTFYDGNPIDNREYYQEEVVYGNSAGGPENHPEMEGYDFTGWDKRFSNVTEDLNINALWKKKEYRVTFEDGNGNILKEDTVLHGESATPPKEPARTGFTFSEWDTSYENVESDLTVKALWKSNEYKVEFTDGNGNIIDTQTIEHGKAASAPSAPERYQYIFKGWDKDFSNVTDNMTVTALWEKNEQNKNNEQNEQNEQNEYTEYTVEFNDGDNGVLDTQTVKHGEAATAPSTPERYGYIFKGWDRDFSNVTGDMVVTALWDLEEYTVTFEDGNGNVLKKEKVPVSCAATEPVAPSREGYIFKGWDNYSFNYITSDLIVKAMWEPVQGQPADNPGNSGEPEQPSDEPDNSGEHGQPTDEPGNQGGQEAPAKGPDDQVEQEQPSNKPENKGEQEQPADEPDSSGETEQPADESHNQGKQEQSSDKPDSSGEQEQPADKPENKGEQEQSTDEQGNSSVPEPSADAPGNSGEQEQPADEPGYSGEQEQSTDEPGNSSVPEPFADAPDNNDKQEHPKDDSANEQDSGKITVNDDRTENAERTSSGNKTSNQAENNAPDATITDSATVQKTAGSGNAFATIAANPGGAVTAAPKTADTNSVGLWSALATGAATALGSVIFRRRRKQD